MKMYRSNKISFGAFYVKFPYFKNVETYWNFKLLYPTIDKVAHAAYHIKALGSSTFLCTVFENIVSLLFSKLQLKFKVSLIV